tara:strand:+ start:20727 stop:21371 length:645 start_codon:yes stop_codon:yes gene_type:complete
MKINFLTYFLYKLISRLFVKIIFSRENQTYVKNYILPIDIIDKYYFLYPCYKNALEETLSVKYKDIIKSKSIIIYPKVNKKKDCIIKKKTNIYIIGNNLLQVNLQLCKTSIKLSNKFNIERIFFRTHPRNNFNISNFNQIRYLIKKDFRNLKNLELDSLILISYSSLLPYFLYRNFNIYVCKKSLLLELKTQKKLESYLAIYKNSYPENKLTVL